MRRVLLALVGTVLSLAFWVAVALSAERVDMALASARGPLGWEVGGIDVGAALALSGIPIHAAMLRFWYGRIDRAPDRTALAWRDALTCSVLSGGYWLACVVVLFGLFAGDPRPGETPPAPGPVYRQEALVAAVLVALHAVASWYWHRRTLRRAG